MAITLRLTKESELTFQELDDNFTDLNDRVITLETNNTDDISLTSLSVTTAIAGTAGLSYNNTTGVFTYTPPDLSALVASNTTKVAIGDNAGAISQGDSSISIGSSAGKTSQGDKAVAIGRNAGETNQDINTVAIGNDAGKTTQGNSAVAIGYLAGETTQGGSAVAIGRQAGNSNQGLQAVALGNLAGFANQAANSIVINATGTEVYNFAASSLVITPIRSATMTTILGYDAGTGEVTHNAAIPGYTNTADLKALVAASTDFTDFQTRIAAL